MKLQLFDPDKETKAFIYQQLNELTPLLPNPMPVVVLTRKLDGARKDRFFVVMVVTLEGQTLRVGARSTSVFDAIVTSRSKLSLVLQSLLNMVGATPEREQVIQSFLNENHSIH
jgi:hypothetical protein